MLLSAYNMCFRNNENARLKEVLVKSVQHVSHASSVGHEEGLGTTKRQNPGQRVSWKEATLQARDG